MAPGSQSATPLAADPALAEIARRIVERTGLIAYANTPQTLAARIDARINALGLSGYAAYLTLLAGAQSEREWDELIAEVTVGETYFFRYSAQMEALRDIVLSGLLTATGKSELRIWCAGCANGAEPYSLAILLRRDLMRETADRQISILGTDICKARLAQAARGAYGEWELRALPEAYRRDCFQKEGGAAVLRDDYKRFVEFRPLNLVMEGPAFEARYAGAFDIILCRNVMIYFSREQNRRLLRHFYGCLKEGGWFVTGHAEPYF
ncbi:MAG: protein-glutamate O-methyltransferase CheR, partial [Amphiplicatus sp.]